jgi:hypothetical protein
VQFAAAVDRYTVDCNLQRPTRLDSLDSARVSWWWWWCCFARPARKLKETVSADRNVGPACTYIPNATLHVPRSIPPVVGELSLEEATLKTLFCPESRVFEHQPSERSMCRNPRISVERLVPQQILLYLFLGMVMRMPAVTAE